MSIEAQHFAMTRGDRWHVASALKLGVEARAAFLDEVDDGEEVVVGLLLGVRDGERVTLLTFDIDYLMLLALAVDNGTMDDATISPEVSADRFPLCRPGWPDEWTDGAGGGWQ